MGSAAIDLWGILMFITARLMFDRDVRGYQVASRQCVWKLLGQKCMAIGWVVTDCYRRPIPVCHVGTLITSYC